MRLIDAKDPTEVKILGLTDPHFTDKDPPAYKVPYLDTLEVAVNSALAYAEKQGADAIVWGGDIYHRKSPAQNSHTLQARMTRLFRRAGTVASINAGILGNHDYPFGELDKGIWGQPAEALLETHTYHLLDEELPITPSGDRLTFPHGPIQIRGDGFSVRIAGASYCHARAEPVRDLKKGDATWLLGIGHFWFGKASGEFFGEPVFGPDFLRHSEVDTYFIGHHHEDQGTQHIDGKIYASIGSCTRTGAHRHDRARRPSAVLFTFTKDKQDATLLRPKFPSADDSLDLIMVEAIKKEAEELDALTHALETAETTSKDPTELANELADSMGASAKTRQRVLGYLERAEQE